VDPAFKIVEPIRCDRWIASSCLQKAIRRGRIELAVSAALTLYAHDRQSLWRRLIVIAVEDVGVGCTNSIEKSIRLCSNYSLRSARGGDLKAIFEVCGLLARAPKDRSADHAISISRNALRLEDVRERIGSLSLEERLDVVAEPTLPLEERQIAAWYASGVEWRPERRVGSGDPPGLVRIWQRLNITTALIEAVQLGVKRSREPIMIMLPLLSAASEGEPDELATPEIGETRIVRSIPTFALDGHTRLGRAAIDRFGRENETVSRLLAETVPDYRARDTLRLAVFHADSALVSMKKVWMVGNHLENAGTAADFESIRVEPAVGTDLIKAIREERGHLEDIWIDLLRNYTITEAIDVPPLFAEAARD
jgi:hypothetical protein